MDREEREGRGRQNGTKRENATYGGFRAELISHSSLSSFADPIAGNHRPTPSLWAESISDSKSHPPGVVRIQSLSATSFFKKCVSLSVIQIHFLQHILVVYVLCSFLDYYQLTILINFNETLTIHPWNQWSWSSLVIMHGQWEVLLNVDNKY